MSLKFSLYDAVQDNNIAKVKFYLCMKADPNGPGGGNWTLLMIASYDGFTGTVKLLLEAGADVNIRNKEGASALMMAARRGHADIVSLLLEADSKVVEGDYETDSFSLAFLYEYNDVVKVLKDHGITKSKVMHASRR